jgi:hypothetical protein
VGEFLDKHKDLLQDIWNLAEDLAVIDSTYAVKSYARARKKIGVIKAKLSGLRLRLLAHEKNENQLRKKTKK